MIYGIGEKVYICGICGISMSTIARLLKAKGHLVYGSDECLCGEVYDGLKNDGVEIYSNLSDESIKSVSPDSFIYSVAIKDKNPEFIYALKNKIQIVSRGEILGRIASEFDKVVAVSGSHGKTTSTSLISHILTNAGLDPTCHIGGISKNLMSNHRLGGASKVFVTEACEYYDSFLSIAPDISIILNIGKDHLDYFKTIENLKKSFWKFAENTKESGLVILNNDDESLKELYNNIKSHKKVLTYSVADKTSDVYVESYRKLGDGKLVFDCNYFGKTISEIYLPLVGKHNLYNALVSIIVAKMFDIDDYSIRKYIASFEGVARRYEFVGKINDANVIHDYAHHPDEIGVVIEEAESTVTGRVFVVFQPHTYSRTKALWNEFTSTLKKAYRTILYPIYPAREKEIDGVTSESLCKYINESGGACYFAPSYDVLYKILKRLLKPEDILLILGAGDIVEFTKYLSIQKDY